MVITTRHKQNSELVGLDVQDLENVTDCIQREHTEMKCYQHQYRKSREPI